MSILDLAHQCFPNDQAKRLVEDRVGSYPTRDLARDLLLARSLLLKLGTLLEWQSWRYGVPKKVEVLLKRGWTSAEVIENQGTRLRVGIRETGEQFQVLLPFNIRKGANHGHFRPAWPEDPPHELILGQIFEFAQDLDGDFYYSPEGWIGELPFSEPFETLEEARAHCAAEINSAREAAGWPLLTKEEAP
jgi:hypothetical protein